MTSLLTSSTGTFDSVLTSEFLSQLAKVLPVAISAANARKCTAAFIFSIFNDVYEG